MWDRHLTRATLLVILTSAAAGQTDGTESGRAYFARCMARVEACLEKYPKLVGKIPIGKSVRGRELFVLRIGPPEQSGSNLPEMYLGGGIHGHEGSERDALWLTEHVLALSDTDPVKTLVRSRVLWVQPFVNPDGIVTNQRKNANGVDLNRNFGGIRMHRGVGRLDDSRYPGRFGFSEPESRAVRDFVSSRTNLRVYLDLHRSVRLIVVPEVDRMGRVSKPCLDAFGPLNKAMGGYHSFSGKFQFNQWGFTADWAWRELGVIAFTWELKTNDAPEFAAADVRWRGLLHLLEHAGTYGRYATPRFATFNACLNRKSAGALIAELKGTDSAQAKALAEILQRVRPDVVLLNEIDHDTDGEAIALLQKNYLARSQGDADPIEYPHVFHAPSNTGVDSGFDLDNNGRKGDPGDAFGFGRFPGQYGMVLLSRYPIDAKRTRTFQKFLWKDMPNAAIPEGWYSKEELDSVRLSSKSHWDVALNVRGVVVHALCAHPTPPVFDGPEDRNGRRNHDEIRLFADYIDPERSRYLVDDAGRRGGLAANEHFVILGDYNADPKDGASRDHAIAQLLAHGAIHGDSVPRSDGAAAATEESGGVNEEHSGDPAHDTGSFGARVGNLRLDYALPSRSLRIVQSGVYWPKPGTPTYPLVGDGTTIVSSDHRLVWCEVELRR